MAHLQPQVYRDTYVSIETTAGTEIIPLEVYGRISEIRPFDDLRQYLTGEPLGDSEMPEELEGWVARMSAPGYLDCTKWTAHKTKAEALAYLSDTYGGE